MKRTSLAVSITSILLTITGSARAAIIDFDAQGTSAPSAFDSRLNSPVTVSVATFTGGELLRNEASAGTSADTTVVYATTGFGAGYSNPLTITFSQAVTDVSLMITNETPDTYTLADNLGRSSVAFAGNNITQVVSLTGGAVTRLTVGASSAVGWDFAIDNVSFTAAVPEPCSVFTIAVGLLGILYLRRRCLSCP